MRGCSLVEDGAKRWDFFHGLWPLRSYSSPVCLSPKFFSIALENSSKSRQTPQPSSPTSTPATSWLILLLHLTTFWYQHGGAIAGKFVSAYKTWGYPAPALPMANSGLRSKHRWRRCRSGACFCIMAIALVNKKLTGSTVVGSSRVLRDAVALASAMWLAAVVRGRQFGRAIAPIMRLRAPTSTSPAICTGLRRGKP